MDKIIELVIEMYITMLPVILAGILNMIWCKTDYASSLRIPMDNNIILKDGKRLFGDNKTWKGFLGMTISGVLSTTIWGAICSNSEFLSYHNYLYKNYDNSLLYNIIIGGILGLTYVVFELPNSFIKRRMDVEPGKHKKGTKGIITILLDQVDSLFGCVLVLYFVYKISFKFYLFFVLLGAITHVIVNLVLFKLNLRKNMF